MGYLRLLRRRGERLYTASEQSELLLLLTDSAGVPDAKIDGIYPKGGYRCDRSPHACLLLVALGTPNTILIIEATDVIVDRIVLG